MSIQNQLLTRIVNVRENIGMFYKVGTRIVFDNTDTGSLPAPEQTFLPGTKVLFVKFEEVANFVVSMKVKPSAYV